MWETIGSVLNGTNVMVILGFIIIALVLLAILIKHGYIRIQTKALKIGDASEIERTIVQQQIDQAHLYIMALENKILKLQPDTGDSYFAKWALERVFDEVVQWITFNNISNDNAYVHVKQMKMCSLVYSLNPGDAFKTPEFRKRVDNWVAELISMLIDIRKLYSKKGVQHEFKED